jgi:catechol 2,3-dioxygenase-like lactoylglutathione lyase family enzyme
MSLSEYKVVVGLAVSGMNRAREFYEGKLGLSVGINSDDNVEYRCAEGSVMHVYLSPEHAGKSTATLASWYVDDVERVVDELTSKGIDFERYDEGPIATDEKGIATFEGGADVAYFRDPDGNTLSIAQAPRNWPRTWPVYFQSTSEKVCSQKFVGVVYNIRAPRSVSGAVDNRVRQLAPLDRLAVQGVVHDGDVR